MSDNSLVAVAQVDQPAPPKFLLPHMQQFQAVWHTPAKTYRFSFDEALKRSKNHALAMRRDGHILSLLQARYLPVLGADWHVKPEDDQFKDQASIYQKLIEKTPRLLQLRKCLLDAIWYGRYGVQFSYGPVTVAGREMMGIKDWKPVNGDKINFTEDGTPTIRVNAAWAAKLELEGANVQKTELSTSYNDQGRVLILDKPMYRQKFAIHIHEIEDADYTEPELAGGVGGVGLRHYCYWIWWLRQEIMEWLLSYLEMMGAGGLTIVGYDAGNPKGLTNAQEAFSERATVVYLPIPPGQEKQTNIVQRIEPSGTGNDIFQGWIDGYFNAILTRIIIGQDLSSKSGATGLGSGVADLQQDVKQCIHRYDAKNLNETETQQILDVLIALNEPNSDYGLKCETVLKSPDAKTDLDAAQEAFNMGAELPESHVRKLASIPEPKEGEKILSKQQQEAESAAMQASMQPPSMAEDDQKKSTQPEDHGMTLEEMRHHLTDQGIPEEDQLHHIADMIDAGELEEIDAEGGVQYAEPSEEEPKTYAREDWTEEKGPKGGERWRNTKTGTIQYKAPGDRAPYPEGKEEEKPRGGDTRVGTLRKGLVTQGAYQSLDRAMRGEANKTLEGEGVLKHVMDADKRMLKAQVISLAAQHGMKIDSKTTKTRALAFIEDRLRSHQGKSDGSAVQGDSAKGKDDATTSDAQGTGKLRDEGSEGVAGTGGSDGKADQDAGRDQQQATAPDANREDQRRTVGGPEAAGDVGGDKALDVFAKGIESSDLTSKMKQQYGQTAKDVHSRLPKAAQERFAMHVESVSFHESPDVLTENIIEKNPAMKAVIGNKKAGGAYSKERKELMLNGGHTMDGKKYNADQIYAHEYAHAIDGPDKELSNSQEWKEAWRDEASKVSKYATKTTAEGFAEFGRLVYSGGLGSDQLRQRYPKMMDHWESQGLLPEGMEKSAGTLSAGDKPQMADVFEEPIETKEMLGDKALARRSHDESLKDFLTGIGAADQHETISGYSKSLHAEAKNQVDEHNEIVRSAMSSLTSHYGKSFTKNHPDMKKDDPAAINGLDTVASELAGSYPHVFGADAGYGGDANDTEASGNAMEKLHGMLKEGIKPAPSLRDFEDQAVQEWHDAGRPGAVVEQGEAAEPENADTSFDVGGEEPVERAGLTWKKNKSDKWAWHEGEKQISGAYPNHDQADYAFDAHGYTQREENNTQVENDFTKHPEYKRLDQTYGNMSHDELKDKIDSMSAQIAENHKVGRREFNENGGRRYGPAMANQGARELGQEKLLLKSYLDHRSASDAGNGSGSSSDTGTTTGEVSGVPGFMQQEAQGPHTAESIPGYAGQSFTNDSGATVDVTKSEDGSWKVGTKSGLTAQGAANYLNSIKAEKAQGLFGDEVTAQKEVEKPKEKLDWKEPAKPKQEAELPGMKDTFAPGMFGAGSKQREQGNELGEWHKDQFDQLSKSMTRQMETVTAPRRKLEVAMRMIHGEAPAVQQALLDHLQKTAPEAYQYGQFNPGAIGLSVRDMFKQHADSKGMMNDVKSDPYDSLATKVGLEDHHFPSLRKRKAGAK